jgi:flagellar basal body rod protein FlgG
LIQKKQFQHEELKVADFTAQMSSSIDALTKELEIITHNLANVSTAGYKRRCNVFTKYLEAQQTSSTEDETGGVSSKAVFDFSQGNLVETSRSLDLGLYGKGFFVIETPEGALYTRNGLFETNLNGQVVDFAGRVVAGENGPIVIPPNVESSQIKVAADGRITGAGAALGQLRLVDFGKDESKLVPIGSNCYLMPDKDIQPVASENVVVKQGYQETSNVKIIDELVNMIMVSRLYEANMKLIATKRDASSSSMSVAAMS